MEGRRNYLASVHSHSIRGAYATEYRTVHTEYIHLQNQFRGIVADHVLMRYRLQQLIIDAAHAHNYARSQRVRRSVNIVVPPLIKSLYIYSSANPASPAYYLHLPLSVLLASRLSSHRWMPVFLDLLTPLAPPLYIFLPLAVFIADTSFRSLKVEALPYVSFAQPHF